MLTGIQTTQMFVHQVNFATRSVLKMPTVLSIVSQLVRWWNRFPLMTINPREICLVADFCRNKNLRNASYAQFRLVVQRQVRIGGNWEVGFCSLF
jgi:hypothetical protein